MKVTVHPSRLGGRVQAPASKSSAQRAIAAALLHHGESEIHNAGNSEDVHAALSVIEALGASIKSKEDIIHITSNGVVPNVDHIHCGESGLGLRMFTPLAAIAEKRLTISGGGSLTERPMDEFDRIFSQAGIEWKSNEGRLPFSLKGPLAPKDIQIDGSLSSQFLTGLLFAYSALGAKATIYVKGLKSRPYIDMTLDVMKAFHMPLPVNNDYTSFSFPGDQKTSHKSERISYAVEGDWSGAAFLLVAGAIAGPVTITGLDMTSLQADRKIVDLLMEANAGIAYDGKAIVVHPTECSPFDFDASECPDLFPPLVAFAAYCKGTSTIGGVSRLLHKESNRADSLLEEFGKMGVPIRIEGDQMIIEGGNPVRGAQVHSHHDHRIAMACAVAALGATGDVVIDQAEAINKSFPSFFEDLEKLGGNVSLKKKFRAHE